MKKCEIWSKMDQFGCTSENTCAILAETASCALAPRLASIDSCCRAIKLPSQAHKQATACLVCRSVVNCKFPNYHKLSTPTKCFEKTT